MCKTINFLIRAIISPENLNFVFSDLLFICLGCAVPQADVVKIQTTRDFSHKTCGRQPFSVLSTET